MKKLKLISLCLLFSFILTGCRLGRPNSESDSLRLPRNTSQNTVNNSRSRKVNERVTSKSNRVTRSVTTTVPTPAPTTTAQNTQTESTSNETTTTTPPVTTTTTTTAATTAPPQNTDFKAIVQYFLDGAKDPSNSGAFNDVHLNEGRYDANSKRVYFDYQLAAVAPQKENFTFDHWAYQIAVGDEIIESGDVFDEPSKKISRWVTLENARKGEIRLIASAIFSPNPTTKPTETSSETSTSEETSTTTTTTTTTTSTTAPTSTTTETTEPSNSSSDLVELTPAVLQYSLDGGVDPDNNNAFADVSLNNYRIDEAASRVYYSYKLSETVPHKQGYEFSHWAYQIVLGDRIIEDADLNEAPGTEINRWVTLDDAKANVRMIAVAKYKEVPTTTSETTTEATTESTTESETSTATTAEETTTTTATVETTTEETDKSSYEVEFKYDLSGGSAQDGQENDFASTVLQSTSVDKDSGVAYFEYQLTNSIPVLPGHKFNGWIYRIYDKDGTLLYDDNETENPGQAVTRAIKISSAEKGLVLVAYANWELIEEETTTTVTESDNTETETVPNESSSETVSESSESSSETIDATSEENSSSEPASPDTEEGQKGLIDQISGNVSGELLYDSYDGSNKQSFFVEKDETGKYKMSLWFTDGHDSRQVFGVSGASVDTVEKVDLNSQKFIVINGKDENGNDISFINTYSNGALVSYRFDGGYVTNVSYGSVYKMRFYDTHFGDYGTGKFRPLFYDIYWHDGQLATASSESVTLDSVKEEVPSIEEIINPLINGGATELNYKKFSDGKYAINYKVGDEKYAVLFSMDPGFVYYYSHEENPDNQIDKAISYGNYESDLVLNRLW